MSAENLALLARGAARVALAASHDLGDLATALELGNDLRAQTLKGRLRRVVPLTIEALELVRDELGGAR